MTCRALARRPVYDFDLNQRVWVDGRVGVVVGRTFGHPMRYDVAFDDRSRQGNLTADQMRAA